MPAGLRLEAEQQQAHLYAAVWISHCPMTYSQWNRHREISSWLSPHRVLQAAQIAASRARWVELVVQASKASSALERMCLAVELVVIPEQIAVWSRKAVQECSNLHARILRASQTASRGGI